MNVRRPRLAAFYQDHRRGDRLVEIAFLFLQRVDFGRKRFYRPTLDDAFTPGKERFIIPIEFSRDQAGNVTAFKTGFDRTGDLIFEKRTR